MTDEVFEQRLRRDLRRLADHLVDGPVESPVRRAWRPPGPAPSSGRGRWQVAGRLALGLWLLVAAFLVGSGMVAGLALSGRPHTSGGASGAAGGQEAAAARAAADSAAALAETSGASAFVSGGELFTAEPGTAPRAVDPVGQDTSAPQWSADGAWIAYLDADDLLHVVQPGGGDDHTVLGAPVAAMTWSPAADLLATIPVAGPQQGDLLLVPVSASADPAPTVVATGVSSFVWSADGDTVAYDRAGAGSQPDQLFVDDVVTGATQPLAYQVPAGDGALLAGWWPDGGGLLLWLDPGHSLAAEATGLELVSVSLTSGDAADLAQTFVYLPWLEWSPDGRQLALVAMPQAFPWQGSQVEVCTPAAGTCRPLPQPAGAVSMDPSWSPDGDELAFVRAPVLGDGSPGGGLDTWYQQRRLWVSGPDGTSAHAVAGAPPGAAEPRFGPGGTTLTVVTGQSVDEVPTVGGTPVTIASDLTGALDTAGPDGYGKLPWGGTVAWGP